jgi:hypothetical protein
MARLNGIPELPLRIREGIEVRYLDPGERDRQVALLTNPWIADEGALDARLERRGDEPGKLLSRGLAFDRERTVTWDEDGIQSIVPAPETDDVVAFAQPVLVRTQLRGPEELVRIDYLRHGVWLASRYLPMTFEQFRSEDHA